MIWMAQAPAQMAHACSVDAGVWAATMDASSVSLLVPRNGALVVRLSCVLGPSCAGDPLAAVGAVLTPSGEEVAGKWTAHDGDVVAFVPNTPFEIGTGYKLKLTGSGAKERSFEVVAAIDAPKSETFEATLELSSKYSGVFASQTCCTNDSCGSGCYYAKQDELAQVGARLTRSPSSFPLEQLELRALSSDDPNLASSCVGCSDLPVLLDSQARDKYCLDLSVRVLGTGVEIALGRQCTASGRASLTQRATPEAEIPSECRGTSDAGTARDAGAHAERDASSSPPSRTDAGIDAFEDAGADEATSADKSDSEAAEDESEPRASSDGCSVSRREPRAWPLGLLLLLACQRMVRRRVR